MIISYKQIGSQSGPFVFIRLFDPVDESKQDILGWAQYISRIHFDNQPVVVALGDKDSERTLRVFPPEFAPVVQGMLVHEVFYSTASVDDIPPLSASGKQGV